MFYSRNNKNITPKSLETPKLNNNFAYPFFPAAMFGRDKSIPSMMTL